VHDITQINYNYLTEAVFSLKTGDKSAFEQLALKLFAVQYHHNPLYKQFCDTFSARPAAVKGIIQIPFIPIEFFKTQKINTPVFKNENPVIFTSSGTSQTGISRHYVNDLALYEKSFLNSFNLFYGNPGEYCILALLPSYLERGDSSLVYMVQKLIELSKHPRSNFYLDNYDELIKTISALKEKKQKTILLGVSYALLDLAEKGINLSENFIVMETGGMKGKREEMLKNELHETLKNKLGAKQIHSEYGMTELLSQAYSEKDGIFKSPPWMKILIRDTNDPFSYLAAGKTGGINVIDLANINSCCFIATQDLGKQYDDESFELMGRFDNSDIRGCNLLIN
jgi:phenylacetate-coenzyme A ligase PaaK-like adenylate-forming protein